MGGYSLMDMEFLFGMTKNILEIVIVIWLYNIINVPNTTELYT